MKKKNIIHRSTGWSCHFPKTAVAINLALAMVASVALADEPPKSAEEIAKELSNPAGSLASLSGNFIYTSFKGDLPDADNQDAWSFQFQPVLPWKVGKGRLIFRPAVTVSFNQPVFEGGSNDFDSLNTNLQDITFDLVYARTVMKEKGHGYLWGVGPTGTLPTATNNALGGDQWRLGPEFFGGIIRPWGIVGALVGNQFNLGGGDGGAGSNDQDYSTMTAQYFYAVSLGKGWQFASSPVITYDWKADSDEAWSIPIGVGLAKTTKIGSRAWKFQGQVQYYAEQPDAFGADWLFKLTITPVVENRLFMAKK